MKNLFPFAKKYRKEIILGPFFKFLEAVFELMLPLLLAKMIDEGLKAGNFSVVVKYTLWMLFLSIAGLLSALVCQYYASIASQGFGTELRNALMEKIHHFSYQQLDQFGPETLITRLTNDITQVQTALAMFIRLFVRAPFLSLGSIIMAFYLNVKMGFIFLIILPLFLGFLFIITYYSVPLYSKVQKRLDAFNNQLEQNLTGVRVIRAFAKRNFMTKKVTTISNYLAKDYEKVANLSALLAPLTTFILNIGILAILYFGGNYVNQGLLPQGEVLALVNYMSQMLLQLIIVSNLIVLFTRAEASGKRVAEVLESENTLTKGQDSLSLPDLKNPVVLEFHQVSFRYTKKSGEVLQNISFQLNQGETLGVIGATGSGKSSLIPLIFHEYEASCGAVSFLGKNVLDLDKNILKSHLGLVPQKAVLFSGTIKDNLSFGKVNPTNEECFHALNLAQIDDFVKSLPNQLDEVVYEGGQNFSGGQKQRLTIARALMKQPKLLILDDSLSALDYETDLNLRKALKEQLQTTTILISQRVATLQNADKILVLHEGKQVGLGTPAELLKTNKIYQEIYQSQQEDAS